MGLRRRAHAIMTGAAVLLGAVSAVALSAASASAGGGLSMSVTITFQNVAGDQCQWGVVFNAAITNSSSGSVTVTSVNSGNYPLSDNAGLAVGAVLRHGTTTFTHVDSYKGPSLGQPCYPLPAPPPLVLTVGTSGGSVTWNQSVSDPQVVTEPQPPGVNQMPGSFDVANCSEYYFQYGVTTQYGKQGDLTTSCANPGTATQFASFTPAQVPSAGYHYRLVVVESGGTKLYGQDQFFTLMGAATPVGSVGLIGVGALAGCALFVTQRRRRNQNQNRNRNRT
jgi:hypothetical protein